MWLQAFTDKFEAFVGVNPFTMIFAWVNILILYLFLKKLLFKPVKNMIDTRQREIDDMYTNAKEAEDASAAMKEEYERRLASANEESEEILKRAVRRAQLREEEILREAADKALRVLERANEEVELEKRRALNEVKDEVSEMAIDIASAIIERDINTDEHSALIDDFIRNMGNEQ